MRIYVINWLFGDVRMYLFPHYDEKRMNHFFDWDIDSEAKYDIKKDMEENQSFKQVKVEDLPEELRENFSFKRMLNSRDNYDFEIFEFKTN